MGRAPCCEKNNGLKKGPWTPEEDQKLLDYIHKHGYGNWRTVPKNAGLQRCGKSCRLRWTNYLRPDIKRGRFSFEEEETIIQLHSILGNKWSAIASRLPGRTDNEIKNFWNTHVRKRLMKMGIDPVTHSPRLDLLDLSSILASSLYGPNSSSQINNIQRFLGMHQNPMVMNNELLKFASSLFSCNSHHQQENNNDQIQNQYLDPQFVQFQDCPVQHLNNNDYISPCHEPGSSLLPLVEPNWDTNNGLIASLSTLAEEGYNNINNIPDQLVSSYDNSNNYYYSSDNNYQNLMDPSTLCSNQNLSFANSVMSTPSSSSSPTTNFSTEDEREISYGSCNNNNNMFRFEIPHVLDGSDFM